MRRALSLVLFLCACQSGAAVGTTCTSSSACASPLVCRFGRCRSECAANRDCPLGAQCFLDPSGLGACELATDHGCGAAPCDPGLTCLSSTCVRACASASDCPPDGTCSIASGASLGVCSDARSGIDAGASDAAPMDAGAPDTHPSDAAPADAGACTPLVAQRVASGMTFTCAIRTDTTVVCWGAAYGLSVGPTPCDATGTPCALAPRIVVLEGSSTPLSNVIDVQCGDDFACALTSTHEVRCWGRNYDAMLGATGDGIVGARQATDAMGVPITDATAIAVGADHACALRSGSRVQCWGQNAAGELGDGTAGTSARVEATAIESVGAIDAIMAMSTSTCVVDAAMHQLHCLGSNATAELGLPTSTTSSTSLVTLAQVTFDTAAPVLSGGIGGACAIDPMGHPECWGTNAGEFLGRNPTSGTPDPSPAIIYGPASASTFTALFGGATRTSNCGVTTTGDLDCWGENDVGQVGIDPAISGGGSAVTRLTSVPPMQSGSCADHCCGVTTSGEVWCWGANDYGQLGRGTTSTPAWQPAPACGP